MSGLAMPKPDQATLARRAGIDLTVVRNGSRGMFELETLVEVETPAGRVGYGPVYPEDVPALVEQIRTRLLTKMGVSSNAELARYAVTHGLMS